MSYSDYNDPDAPWNQELDAGQWGNWNGDVVEEFRKNKGKVSGAYEGSTLLLLTTTGARSGEQRVVPLGALYRDKTLYVSSFIEDKYPAWWHNLKADPQAFVEIGDRKHRAVGRVLEGPEYEEFAAWVLANNPMLAQFQATVKRPLPLVVLELGEEV